jgi:Ca-activated chloride channel family protein
LVFPALLFLVLTGSAQDVQIRTRVDLVVVPVTVKDKGDRLVTSLTKDDFVVLEDGRRQTITNFTIDPVPLSAAVLVDTGLSASSLSKVQKTFPALAGAFSEFDEVALYRFDKFVKKVLDFSRDSGVVETSMKTLGDVKGDPMPYPPAPGGPFSIPGPVINGGAVVPPGQIGPASTAQPKRIKVLNDAIFEAASDLAKRERDRRKVVLVISDGYNQGSDHSYDDTVKSLLETGIEVYAVGLEQSIIPRSLSLLNKYAMATGGDAYFVSSIQNIEQSYATAAEAARNQYVLGYVSSNKAYGTEPVFRGIAVTVARAGLETRHRKGYYQFP